MGGLGIEVLDACGWRQTVRNCGYISASQALISTVGEHSTGVQFTPIQAKEALRFT